MRGETFSGGEEFSTEGEQKNSPCFGGFVIYDLEEKLKKALTPALLKRIEKLIGAEKLTVSVNVNTYGQIGCSFWADEGKHVVAAFYLSELPANGSILVSHSVYVHEDYKNKGLGTLLCKLRSDVAKQAGAQMIIATVNSSNAAEKKVLERCDWRIGPKAGNIHMWTRVL